MTNPPRSRTELTRTLVAGFGLASPAERAAALHELHRFEVERGEALLRLHDRMQGDVADARRAVLQESEGSTVHDHLACAVEAVADYLEALHQVVQDGTDAWLESLYAILATPDRMAWPAPGDQQTTGHRATAGDSANDTDRRDIR